MNDPEKAAFWDEMYQRRIASKEWHGGSPQPFSHVLQQVATKKPTKRKADDERGGQQEAKQQKMQASPADYATTLSNNLSLAGENGERCPRSPSYHSSEYSTFETDDSVDINVFDVEHDTVADTLRDHITLSTLPSQSLLAAGSGHSEVATKSVNVNVGGDMVVPDNVDEGSVAAAAAAAAANGASDKPWRTSCVVS